MSQDQFQRRIQEDMTRLRRVLGNALRQADFRPASDSRINLLDLACGPCHEAELLVDLFADPESTGKKAAAASGREARLTGIDIREREIAEAQARCGPHLRAGIGVAPSESPEIRRFFEFLAADATRVTSHKELPEEFDVVFLRHQNFYDGASVWNEIFSQGLEKLSSGGILVLTSYFDREHDLALEAVRKLGGKLIVTEENPRARRLSAPGKFVDKHVAVFAGSGD